jgi:hypothetical protein
MYHKKESGITENLSKDFDTAQRKAGFCFHWEMSHGGQPAGSQLLHDISNGSKLHLHNTVLALRD